MKRLGVLTRDFRVLHELVRRLNSRGILYRVLDDRDPIPADVGAVLTSWKDFLQREDPRLEQRDLHGRRASAIFVPKDLAVVSVRLDDEGEEDYSRAIEQALRALSGVETYRRLIVGIDPGDHPGIAFLGDGLVVHTGHVSSPDEVIGHLRSFLSSFPTKECVIRVGHGARLHRNRILNDLVDLQVEDVRIEVADETGTTPTMNRKPSSHVTRDIQAAIGIALTRGRPVERKVRLDVRPGEVAEIQRNSRIQSEGELTVSRALAVEVAKGVLTLEQAIQRQRRSSGA